MNWIWIIVLLCCCKGNNNDNCIQPRREERRACPRAPFAPECDRDCGCRASELDSEICEE